MATGKIKDGTRWGIWRLASDSMHLVAEKNGEERYAVSLLDMTDSAHMLDWIFQLRPKTWVTNDVIGDLLTALQDIFRPQATLCGYGKDKKLNAAKHLAVKIVS